MPRGETRIEVKFSVDTDGIMSCTARELSAGVEKNITITNNKGRLSEQEIDQMIKNANEEKDNDLKIKETIEAEHKLVSYVEKVEKIITTDEFKTKLDESKQKLYKLLIDEVKKWLRNSTGQYTKKDYDEQYELLNNI